MILSTNYQYIEIDIAVNAVKREKKRRQREEKNRIA